MRPAGRRATQRSNAILVYVLLILVLQTFLLVVAVEGLLGDEDDLAWTSAALSSGLFAGGLVFVRFLRDD